MTISVRSHAAILLGVLLTAPAAFAEGFTIGPSMGTFSSGAGTVYGIDAALMPWHEHWPAWISGGLRGTSSVDGNRYMPYAEVGAWVFVNVGLGVTMATGGGYDTGVLGHGFVGVPIGSFGDAPAVYIEPYWRPAYGTLFDHPTWYNELGIMLKVGVARAQLNLRF